MSTPLFALYILSEQNIFCLKEYFVFAAVGVSSGKDVSCVANAAKWLCDVGLYPCVSLPT